MPCHDTSGREMNFKSTLNEICTEDIQLILILDRVDEDSTKRILRILGEFPNLDYELISGSYGNPGAARNAGLKLTKGDWVAFWDFDDVPNSRALRTDFFAAEKEGYDAVIGGYEVLDFCNNNKTVAHYLGPDYLAKIGLNPGIWRFIFSKKSIENLNFPHISMGEDQVFIGQFFRNSPRILVSKGIFYRYFVGDPRQTTKNRRLLWDLMISSEILLKAINDKTAENKNLIAKLVFRQLVTSIVRGEPKLKARAICKLIKNWRVLQLSLRSPNERKVMVHLTGGLGNQLFQFAAATSFSGGRGIELETTFGRPRMNQKCEPEILSFELPNTWNIRNKRFGSQIISKVLGFNLRKGINPSRFEERAPMDFLIGLLSDLILTLFLKTNVHVEASNGVGFSSPLLYPNRTNYLIGYFQSYKWASSLEVLPQLQQLRSKDWNLTIEKWVEISKIERPLVVHFRLGDYKLEKNFGNLSKDYYEDAINLGWEMGNYGKIWVFSDEIEVAKKLFGIEILDSARWIDTSDESSANVLEIMRMGNGYIIANSSFSWWGAFLSHSENPVVIAPSPWFKGEEEPVDLIPPHWMRLNAKWN
jgi:glycosyltransferase involved in cell wall biosynthesis